MLVLLRFFRICCFGLLGVCLIIATQWIYQLYGGGPEADYLHSGHLNFISWYVMAPLIGILLIINFSEFRMVRGDFKKTGKHPDGHL